MLENIKLLLGVTDNLQDSVIELIVSNVSAHLQSLLGKKIPTELEFIVIELSTRRYQRLGSEGMKSELVEGHRVDFYDLNKEFDPYMPIIEANKEDEGTSGVRRGKVLFY